MKIVRWMVVMVLVLLLAGCDTVPEETLAPETAVPTTAAAETAMPETIVPETTAPETTVPETTQAPTEPPETTVPEGTLQIGYYVLTQGYNDGKAWTDAEVEERKIYIWIRPGHTGTMSMNGWNYHLDWTTRVLLVDGTNWSYTLEGDTLTVDNAHKEKLILTYCGDVLSEEYGDCTLQPGMYIVYARWDEYYKTYEKFSSYQVDNGVLDLKEDHTGVLIYRGERSNIKWDEGSIMRISTPMEYSIQEEAPLRIHVYYGREVLYLERLPSPVPYE